MKVILQMSVKYNTKWYLNVSSFNEMYPKLIVAYKHRDLEVYFADTHILSVKVRKSQRSK